MPGPTLSMQDVHDFNNRLPAMKYVRGARNSVANLWMFHSPKNNLRYPIQTDRDFGQFVLLEGNIEVTRYLPYPLQPVLELHKTASDFAPSAQIFLRDGSTEWWVFRDMPLKSTPRSRRRDHREVHTDGATVRYYGRDDFTGREIEFDNWLVLCSAITRNLRYDKHNEENLLKELAYSKASFRLRECLGLKGADPSLMLSTVASMLQAGLLRAELKKTLFSLNSKMNWTA